MFLWCLQGGQTFWYKVINIMFVGGYLFDSSDDHQGFDYLCTGCIGHEKFFLNMPWTLDIEVFCKGLQVINGCLQRGCVFALSSELVSSVSF
jgi:hypothetical protein